ncbi:MAG: DUF86 domain-containing protein [Clostridia bacterium]|nr:DUF86 domain-containing protein [Clostridia bacterium]
MDNKKDNGYYVKKIVNDLNFIIKHTNNLTISDLVENEVLVDSVMFRLIQVSENSDKLTDDFKIRHNTIPWRAVKGMRNRIVHEYGNVDMSVVYDTVKNDIPNLLLELKEIADKNIGS